MKPLRLTPPTSITCAALVGVTALLASACSQQVEPAVAPAKEAREAPRAAPSEAAPDTPDEATSTGEAPEGDHKNTIRWSTASEVENFGFNVYRGDQREGPFERLNEEIIEGGYTTDEPQSYTFIDRDIDPYRSYFYYVESVSLSGVRETFTPVIEAKPKLERSAE